MKQDSFIFVMAIFGQLHFMYHVSPVLGAHSLYSEINLMSQACVLCPQYARLLSHSSSHHVLVVEVGRGAQHPGHLGTFSAEDCEVMARGGHGVAIPQNMPTNTVVWYSPWAMFYHHQHLQASQAQLYTCTAKDSCETSASPQ